MTLCREVNKIRLRNKFLQKFRQRVKESIYEFISDSGISVLCWFGDRVGDRAAVPPVHFLREPGAEVDQPRLLHGPVSADLWLRALSAVSSGIAGKNEFCVLFS